jgi:Ca2+-binding RTX toxin-like protein
MISQAQLDEANRLLDVARDTSLSALEARGARTEVYLYLYEAYKAIGTPEALDGARQLLLQAYITSFSGFIGGAAILGNAIAKFGSPENYNLTLTQFSIDIIAGLLDTIDIEVNENGGDGVLSADEIQRADSQVWIDKNLGQYFPGNFQLWDESPDFLFSAGNLSAALSGLQLAFGGQIGYEREDYPGLYWDTSNDDYDVLRIGGPEGRAVYIEDKIGVKQEFVPDVVEDDPGAVFLLATLGISSAYGIGLAIPFFGAVLAGLGAATFWTILNNEATRNAVGELYQQSFQDLFKTTETDRDLRAAFERYVGINGNEFVPSSDLPEDLIFDDFALVLRNEGVFQDNETGHVVFAYSDAVVMGNGGGELGFAFDESAIIGGAENDYLFAKDNAFISGDEGGDILIATDLATADGGDGVDILIGLEGANLSAGGGALDLILSIDGYGSIDGGAGTDVILAFNSRFVRQNEPVGNTLVPPDEQQFAETDLNLQINGGSGEDIIVVFGGEGAEVVGGTGRDFIWNRSFSGSIFGNGKDGAGAGESDAFWWSPGVFLQDADFSDVLSVFVFPLVGATTAFGGGQLYDTLNPFITYNFSSSGQLIVSLGPIAPSMSNEEILRRSFIVEDVDFGEDGGRGDLGLRFLFFGQDGDREVSLLQAVFTLLGFYADQILNWAKKLAWVTEIDPLILDLDGDGVETTRLSQSDVYFDIDGDFFREKTAWVEADDGILALDFNGNGVIDDISELFGGVGELGLDQLAELDSNNDGVIDANDIRFDDLRVWQDFSQDGVSDDGELSTLAELGIVSLGLTGTPQGEDGLGRQTPTENTILSEASFTRADGSTGTLAEVILQSDDIDTLYRGDNGIAGWAARLSATDAAAVGITGETGIIDMRGYGELTNLAVAASNSASLNAELMSATLAMTTPEIGALRALTSPVISEWVSVDPLSRELTPLLISAEGELLDRGVYVEDGAGGFWTLESGAAILAGDGSAIARATLEDILAQTSAGGSWELQQLWSPSDRSSAVQHRENAPYLVEVVDGRAQILDYGIWVENGASGYWRLASGNDILANDGSVIAEPSTDEVLNSIASDGREWRVEALTFNAFEALPFESVAVYLVDGIVTDYSVYIDDPAGGYHVWARNLDRALQLQEADGFGGGFALRNFEIDLENLPNADSTDDSSIRTEVLSIDQYRFATTLFGIEFDPTVLSATISAENSIEYDVSAAAAAGQSPDTDPGQRDIDLAISLFNSVIEVYVPAERGIAVRLAAEGGLAPFFVGIDYNVATDKFVPTGGRELAQMFEAIFAATPSATQEEAVNYLRDWNDILQILYADYDTNLQTIDFSVYLFQNVVAGYENAGLTTDILAVADALGLREEDIRLHETSDTVVEGTSGTDIFYMSEGDQTFRGGDGRDFYVVGRNFGNDIIEDVEAPLTGVRAPDTLWFSHVTSEEVSLTKDGLDLIITVDATGETLTIVNQFDGELPSLFGGDLSADTEIVSIYFADGVQWQELDIAFEAANPRASDDLVLGTPDLDVLDGGAGNDILRGGADSDLYIFNYGYGQDIIDDNNDRLLLEGLDFLQFQDGIREEDLQFERNGDSNDVTVFLLDDEGVRTGDSVTVINQFNATDTLVLGVKWIDRLERFTFDDGSFLTEQDIMRLVLEQAGTDNADAIYGFFEEDTLDGGLGDDFLSGGDLDDTYVFATGYGRDVIEDNLSSFLRDSYDTLQFSDINADQLNLVRDGSSLTVTLQIAGTSDEVILRNQFALTGTIIFGDFYLDNIDEIQFADGSVWDFDDLARRFLDQASTDGDDVVYGFDRNDVLDGGAGNDRLEGGVYSDTYIFGIGYGQDTIYDASRSSLLSAGYDTLVLDGLNYLDFDFERDGVDLTLVIRSTGESVTLEGQYDRLRDTRIEQFVFADQTLPNTDLNPEDIDLVGTDGDDTLTGTHYAETIDGRAGNDTLIGSSDGDTYLFDVGYGDDVIIDRIDARQYTADDTVKFGADITTTNINFTRDVDDLVITIDGRTDTLRIRDQFGPSVLNGVELFEFDDGTVFNITDIEELLAITGGNRGDNIINGLDDRDNVLDGRQGDDQLNGGNASDTYAFGVGYDIDIITETRDANSNAGAVDRVVFGELITPESLLVRRDGDDLILTVIDGTDELRVAEGLSERQIEEFIFADGTVWTQSDIQDQLLRSTDDADRLTGFDGRDDLLDGGLGNDILEGRGGNDTYRFEIGYGSDSISDAGGVDRIEFGDLITPQNISFAEDDGNLVIRFAGADDTLVILDALMSGSAAIETLAFADGTEIDLSTILTGLIESQATSGSDVVLGTDDADALSGGAGDDFLSGGSSGDVYTVLANEGFDTIDDQGGSGTDRLVLSQYESSDVTVRRAHPDRPDAILSFASTGDEILIRGGLEDGNASAIESIEFVDGVIWTPADLRAQVLAAAISAGDDAVYGFDTDDAIAGGLGDDVLYGEGGSDTYTFSRGDGRDVIDDDATTSGNTDTLVLRGYTPDEVIVTRPDPNGQDLLIQFEGSTDEILLINQFSTGAGRGLEAIQFGDGTSWDRSFIVGLLTAGGTDRDETIEGTGGSDLLIGRGGNDVLNGRDGSDTYVYSRGDGIDVIEDNGNRDTDIVRIEDYDPSDVLLSIAGDDADTLILTFAGTSDRLRINNTINQDAGDAIEEIHFQDGTIWTMQDVRTQLVAAQLSDGADTITGFNLEETIRAGLGDDFVSGLDGSDTYIFARGDGRDTITDSGNRDTDVLIIEGYTPAEVLVSAAPEARDVLVLDFVGTDDQIRITGTLNSSANSQIEEIRFDDGTVWNMTDVRTTIIEQQQTAGNDVVDAFAFNETLRGGLGDDALFGYDGSDTYIFQRGDGSDVIEDNGNRDTDVLQIEGYTPAELILSTGFENRNDLIINFVGTDDQIRVVDTINGAAGDAIEEIRFDDGTVWTNEDVRNMIIAQMTTSGDDDVQGYGFGEIIIGGTGNDSLIGGDGSDTYIFARGDGQDRIEDNGNRDTDVLRIEGYSAAEIIFEADDDDLIVTFVGTDDRITVISTLLGSASDQIEQIELDDGTVWTIGEVAALATPVVITDVATDGDDRFVGTGVAETFEPGLGDDQVTGGAGSDTYIYNRGDGDDVYFEPDSFGSNNANDVVELRGIDVADVTISRTRNAVVIEIAESAPGAGDAGSLTFEDSFNGSFERGIDRVVFDDGTIWTRSDFQRLYIESLQTAGDDRIVASNASDTIEAGLGDDFINGGNSSDTYIYNRGDGHDTIIDPDINGGSNDTLDLRGIAVSDVTITTFGNDVTLHIAESAPGAGDGGRVTLIDSFSSNFSQGIDRVLFEDGTEWNQQFFRDAVQAATVTDGDDYLVGTSNSDVLEAGRGDDVVAGGGSGDDRYIYNRGDGNDLFIENRVGNTDTIELRGIDVSAVTVTRSGSDFVLNIAESTLGAGDAGRIVMQGSATSSNNSRIEFVEFDDGTIWDEAFLRASVLAGEASSGDNTLRGFNRSDVFDAGEGNDTIIGGNGNDTYIYERGDGFDTIGEFGISSGDSDTVRLVNILLSEVRFSEGFNNTLVLTIAPRDGGDGGRIELLRSTVNDFQNGVEFVEFDDGTILDRAQMLQLLAAQAATDGDDVIIGGSDADILIGLEGNDALEGAGGDDTYIFNNGDGRDVIRDGGSGDDTIEIRGYSDDALRITRLSDNSDDFVIRFEGSADSITVLNGLSGSDADTIERLVLADSGTVLTIAQIRDRLLLDAASANADTILGTDLADQLNGGAGADLLDGRGGDDTYIYRIGDGVDRLEDSSSSTADVLQIEGYTVGDITSLRRSPANGDDLIIEFSGAGDLLFVGSALNADSEGIELVSFEDGTTWTITDLRALVLAGASSASIETIYGFDGDDTLTSLSGDDKLIGGDGSDTYQYSQGDGNDIIEDNGDGDFDRVVISGYASSEVSVSRYYLADDGIVLNFAGSSTDSLTILNTLFGDNEDGIEEIEFSDGVIWTMATVQALLENTAPVAERDGIFSVVQEIGTVIAAEDLLRNDFDPDGDPLTIIAVSGAENGTVQLDQNGDVLFTSAEGYTGLATFEYTVSDGNNGLTTQTVTVRVRPPATAVDDAGFTVDEDSFLTIPSARLLANDVDGDILLISQVINPVGGTVSLSSNGDVTFTPDPNFNGEASFTYVANTPAGGRAEGQVFITVLPINDDPTANNDSGFNTLEDQAFTILASELLANDSDIDGDDLSIVSVTGDGNISVALNEFGEIVVTPTAFFFGNASFTYEISDGNGGTSTATASVFVEPVNNLPEPADDAFTTDEDVALLVTAAELLANDVERDGDLLTITAVSNGLGGTAELLPNDTILFTPADNFFGQAYYFYTVDDGQGGQTTARVNVQIDPVNDRPEAGDDSFENVGSSVLIGTEDETLIIDPAALLGNDTDVDSVSISIVSVSNAVNGTVTLLGDGTIQFIPDPDYWGEASFTYVISDGEGGVDDATVELYFEPVSDAPPIAGDDEITIFEDVITTVLASEILANDTDIDNDPLTIVSVGTGGPGDYVSLDGDGNIVIDTPDNLNGVFFFDYVVSDGADGFDTGRVRVNVTPVNDDPTAGIDTGSTTLDAPLVVRISDLLANDTDVDFQGGAVPAPFLTFVNAFNASIGTISVYEDEFVVVDLPEGYSGDVTFNYTVADQDGATDTGLVNATVSDQRAAVITGTSDRDLLIGTQLAERLEGSDGNDDLFGREGDDTLDGGDGADEIDGGEGFDTVDYSGSTFGVRADLVSRLGQGGFAQGDLLTSIEGVIGSDFEDQLFGGAEANTLEGGDAADLLDGRAGADTLLGGEGDDTLIGGEGADVLDGGAGIDTADYSGSALGISVSLDTGTVSGGDAEGDTLNSIENILGTLESDVIEGDENDNVLDGSRGDDIIRGLGGDDILIGGRGADQLDGGEGIDTADYSQSATAVTVDMSGATAGGGDAEGDTFTNIERIVGSSQDDTIIGDANDNTFIGGAGADTLTGGAGNDTADYSSSLAGVTVDLAAGTGLGGDAEGDQLSEIETVVGSNLSDTLIGDAGDNTFDGGFADDELRGGEGSDRYIFGFDSSSDTIVEQGNAGDIDRVIFAEGVEVADVSLVRDGDSLLIELENDDGFLIDTLFVQDHFLGTETGIEELVFSDGTIYTREDIFNLYRNDRFNAVDDTVRFADEDLGFNIDASLLTGNDTETGDDTLTIISVQNGVNGTAVLNADGSVTFTGAQDFNGFAFFDYTVSDGRGRESTATVEVEIRAVNDDPIANDDGIIFVEEDVTTFIPIETLIANDLDIDSDNLTIIAVGPLIDENGDTLGDASGYNGSAVALGNGVSFEGANNYFGAAGFSYTVSDGNGGTATANVEIQITAVNDAPEARADDFETRQDQAITIAAASLISNDIDVENDPISFVSAQGAVNGTLNIIETPILDGDGVQIDTEFDIVFTPDAGFLGQASFTYTVTDGSGLTATATVEVDVIPLNDPPVAADDSYTNNVALELVEDTPLVIDPIVLLSNDFDIDGDTLTITELDPFPENGSVAFDQDGNIVFTPRENYNGEASFFYTISDGISGTSTAEVTLFINAQNDGSFVLDDEITAFEGGTIIIPAFEVFANDIELDGDVLFFDTFELVSGSGSLNLFGDDLALGLGGDDYGQFIIRYTAVDTVGATSANTGTITVNVLPQRELPSVGSETDSVAQNTPYTVSFADLLANDSDGDGDFLAILSVDDPANGSIEITQTAGVLFNENDAPRRVVTFELPADLFGDLDQAGLTPQATLVDGSPLPSWVTFDGTSFVAELPEGYDQALRIRLSASDGDTSGSYIFHLVHTNETDTALSDDFVLEKGDTLVDGVDLADGQGTLQFVLSAETQAEFVGATSITVLTSTGDPIPSWLTFDPVNATFEGVPPNASAATGVLDLVLIADGGISANAAIRLIPPAATGLDVDYGEIALLDASAASRGEMQFTILADAIAGLDAATLSLVVTLADGSPLPDWLSVNGTVISGTPPADFVDTGIEISVSASDATTTIDLDFTLAVDAAPYKFVTYTPNTDYVGTETITYTVTDNTDGTRTGTITLDVFQTDVAPEAADDAFNGIEDTPLLIAISDLLANDSDDDGDPIRVISVQDALNGTVVIDGDNVVYTPNQNFSGVDTFTYTITDDRNGTSTATVTVTVEPQNDAPVANLDQFVGTEDTPLTISFADLLANDSDPEGDPITFDSIVTQGQGGLAAVILGDQVTFTPDENFNGTAIFTYTISDGRLTTQGQIEIEFAPVNDGPVAIDDGVFSFGEDETFSINAADLIANDADVEGDEIFFVSAQDGFNGDVSFDNGVITFTPREDYFGNAEFTYTVQDADGQMSTATVFLLVTPQNDIPVAVSDTGFTVAEDGVLLIDSDALIANDTDRDGDPITFTRIVSVSGGTAVIDGAGQITFTPTADFNGTATLIYEITDGNGGFATGTASIDVTPVDDAPRLAADAFVGTEDQAVVIPVLSLLANDFDPDGHSFQVTSVFDAIGGTVELDGSGNIIFTPAANVNGDVSFRYTVTDITGETATSDVTIDLAAVNDAPELAAPLADQAFGEDSFVDFTVPAGAFTDIDGDALTLNATLANGDPLPAWLGFDGARFSGQPPANFNGLIAIAVIATDGELSVSDTFDLTITSENDAPVLSGALDDQSFAEDSAVSFAIPAGAFEDVDGDSLTFSATLVDGAPLPAWLSFDGTSFAGQSPADFNGDIAIRVTASDGALEVSDDFTLSITPENDAPIIQQLIGDQSGTEDTRFIFVLPVDAFEDVDGDVLTITATLANGDPLPAWLTFDGQTLDGTPPADFNGDIDVTVSASDGLASVSQSFTLTIDAVNDAPIVVITLGDQFSDEDTDVNFALPAGLFSDVDGDTLTVTATLDDGSALPAWLSFDGTAFTGTPPANFAGTIGIRLNASDGALDAETTFNLVINQVNDAPIAVDDTAETDEDQVLTLPILSLLANDFDLENNSFQLTEITSSTNGSAALDGNGNVVFTPAANFFGVAAFTYLVVDIFGASAEATVSVNVISVNDAPVFTGTLVNQASDEDTAVFFELPTDLFNDVDDATLTVTATLANGLPLPSWLSFVDGDFIGTPPQDFNGVLEIAVIASDGEATAQGLFELEITAVNDRPVLDAPLSDRFVLEDEPFSVILQDVFSDVDGDALTLTATLADGSPLPSWISFDGATRTLSGEPPANFNGEIDILITASDGALGVSNSFLFTVTNVNDAPEVQTPITDVSFDEDTPVIVEIPAETFTDIDGDTLQIDATLASGAALPDWLTLSGTTLVGMPPQDFNGVIDILITADDGLATVSDTFSIDITPVNDAPVTNTDFGFEAVAGADLIIDQSALLANDTDPDGDTLTVIGVSGAGGGDVALSEEGLIIYTPDDSFLGTDSFSYIVSDGQESSIGFAVVTVEDPYSDYDQGTDGNDVLFGSLFEENSIYGGDGDDIVFGGVLADNLAGGAGDDIILGFGGADLIEGNSGDDTLLGGRGRDDIYGGTGNDILFGGRGQDTFYFSEGDGQDTIADFQRGRSNAFFTIAGDRIALDIDGVTSFEDLLDFASQQGRSTVFDFGDGDVLILNATRLAALDEDMFTFT